MHPRLHIAASAVLLGAACFSAEVPAATATAPAVSARATTSAPVSSTLDLSTSCGAAGTAAYTERAPDVAVPSASVRGTLITVTTASDASGADTSTVRRLLASSGPAGISLREAIEATNNDPAEYTIGFARELSGSTVELSTGLPILRGGSVFINGDIDDDGKPHITLSAKEGRAIDAFTISSSNNRIHAIGLKGFGEGVVFAPLSAGGTFRENTLSSLVMTDLRGRGVSLSSSVLPRGQVGASGNAWSGIQIIGNTIQGQDRGIGLLLVQSSGAVLEHVTIAGNSIRVDQPASPDELAGGIEIASGFRAGADSNRISDVLIVGNSISGNAMQGVRISAGDVGGSENVTEHVRIVANRIRIAPTMHEGGAETGTAGVSVITGDGATDYIEPARRPVVYPERNTMSDIVINGNTIEGPGGVGIGVSAGTFGPAKDVISGLRIEGNSIRLTARDSLQAGVQLSGATGGSRPGSDNAITDVTIRANSIQSVMDPPRGGNRYFAGGIRIEGGNNSERNTVRDVRVENNAIETELSAVVLVAARGTRLSTTQNTVAAVSVTCNELPRSTVVQGRDQYAGITLIGGDRAAAGSAEPSVTGNAVLDTTVRGNHITRQRDVDVMTDRGGASGNTVAEPRR